MRKLTEDFIGVCQWCFGEYKINRDLHLTLHGYQRPGHGYVVGRCPGVGHNPFEYSHELTDLHLNQMYEEAASLKKSIARIDAGELKRVRNPNFVADTKKRDRYYDAETPEFILPEDRLFPILVKRLHANLSNELAFLTRTITHFEELIRNWTRGKIVGIDTPATGRVRELRDAFSAEEADKKAEIAAAKAARDAKPGKLMLTVFHQFAYPPRADGDEAAWRAGIEKMHAAEEAFKKAVKKIAKERYPEGKIWIGVAYGGDAESAYRRAGRPLTTGERSHTEAIAIKPDWQYLDAVLAAFPDAVKREEKNGKEVRLFLSFDEFSA